VFLLEAGHFFAYAGPVEQHEGARLVLLEPIEYRGQVNRSKGRACADAVRYGSLSSSYLVNASIVLSDIPPGHGNQEPS
jgi:hypothetical protein